MTDTHTRLIKHKEYILNYQSKWIFHQISKHSITLIVIVNWFWIDHKWSISVLIVVVSDQKSQDIVNVWNVFVAPTAIVYLRDWCKAKFRCKYPTLGAIVYDFNQYSNNPKPIQSYHHITVIFVCDCLMRPETKLNDTMLSKKLFSNCNDGQVPFHLHWIAVFSWQIGKFLIFSVFNL